MLDGMLDMPQSSIIDDDMSLDIMELSMDDMELSIDDIGGQLLEDDIIELSIDDIELSIIELDDASWAKPGTTAEAKLPATSRAATTQSCFFMVFLLASSFASGG